MEDDGDDKDDSKRRTRNMSEKKRRDQFNLLVNELSTMVSASSRKMDKSTVLKSTISFLKNHNEITVKSRAHDIRGDWKPGFLSNEEFTYLVLEALEGFVMVFSATGHIHYVSESITPLLGQSVTDVVNKSIFDLAFEEDRQNLYNLLQGPKTAVDSILRVGQGNEIRFQCHLRRGMLDVKDESTYELIEFNGHFRSNTEPFDDEEMYQLEPESRVLFVCTCRLSTPQLIRDVSLAAASEFTSRHSLEWKFLFLDHRAPPIIGYLPFEVLGTSGYDYYHFDDLEKVVNCHEELMEKGELTSCYYRFLTKGQQWIWLQTRFYITYHQWNSKPEFVVCTHRVVNYADVAKSEKQEISEEVIGNEEQAEATVKKVPSEESIRGVSPTYMSEASEPYGSSYQPMSQDVSVKSGSAPSTMTSTADTLPTSLGTWPRSCSTRYAAGSDSASVRYVPSDTISVRYAPSDSMSVRYASSDTASARYVAESDTASLSGESRSSHRSSTLENRTVRIHGYNTVNHGTVMTFQQTKTKRSLVPERAIGAEYLEPAPYVNAIGPVGTVPALAPLGAIGAMGAMGAIGAVGAVGPMGAMAAPAVHSVQGVIPLSIQSLPMIVTPDQAQVQWPWQEQLQQKHEKLQQMIMRQQEELRQVKEQLLLARLGMLQPLPTVPPPYLDEPIQNAPSLPAAIVYEEQPGRQTISRYPPQPPPGHPHLPQ